MIGETLNGYHILERVGTGGMATVFKAHDPSMNRIVAIKVLHAQHTHNPVFRTRFEQEARAVARLEHLHIVPIFYYGEENDVLYMVTRFMDTGTLTDYMEQHGQLAFIDAARIIRHIAGALDYAHVRNIIHRDVKPSNVMMDDEDNAFLMDFGIARILEATQLTTSGTLIGTPQYMSPEQCMGTGISPASDQYSLAVMLYEMLTGRTPFNEDTPMGMIRVHIAGESLPLPHKLRSDLPPLAERVLIKALSRAPDDRFVNCVTFAEAFKEATTGVLATKQFNFTLPPIPEPVEKDTVKLDAPPEPEKNDNNSNFIYHLLLIGLVALMVIMGVMSSIFIRGMRLIWSVEQSLTEQAVVTQTADVELEITIEP